MGNGRDLWTFGVTSVREQSADLEQFAARLGDEHSSLKAHVLEAKRATDGFAAWLDAEAPRKTGPSGIGIDHYDWYLRNVHLVPYTWHEQLALVQRELGRAHTFLAYEEQRNRQLPPQEPVASPEEHAARFPAAVADYMAFLRDHDILTVRDFMEPALLARIGRFRPGPREFFTEVDYRDPVVMRTHGYHWFDLARMKAEPHASPIRRVPLLYNLFDSRTEGLATGWEEMMLQAGMFDSRPRSRELIYVLLGAAGGARHRRPADARQPVHASSRPPRSPPPTRRAAGCASTAPRCAASSTCTSSSPRTARAISSARCRSSR